MSLVHYCLPMHFLLFILEEYLFCKGVPHYLISLLALGVYGWFFMPTEFSRILPSLLHFEMDMNFSKTCFLRKSLIKAPTSNVA